MRTVLFAAAALAAWLAGAQPASAQWCAFYDPYTYTCGFRSFEQCLATVRGVGGICRRDYRYDEERRSRRRSRQR